MVKYAYKLTNAAEYLDMSMPFFRKNIMPILREANAIFVRDTLKRVNRTDLEWAFEQFKKNEGEGKCDNTERQASSGKTEVGGSTSDFSANISTSLAQRLAQRKQSAV